MSDTKELLERALRQAPQPERVMDSLIRRRARKQRNRRIAAGVVGLAIGLAAILAGASVIRSSGSVPANPTPRLPSLRQGGEVVEGGCNYEVCGGVRNRPVGLFAIDPETGERRTLTDCTDPCNAIVDPAWSPNGSRVAYFVNACTYTKPLSCAPETGLWVMDSLGRVQLTNCPDPIFPKQPPGGVFCPGDAFVWFPDSARLAYVQYLRPSQSEQLIAVDVDGSHRSVLRLPGVTPPLVPLPVWSPDGTRLAYMGDEGIHVMPTEGGDATLVAESVGVNGINSFQWSPDGASILFYERFHRTGSEDRDRFSVVNADGSGLRVVLDQPVSDEPGAPAWSPDGTKIAFVATPEATGGTGNGCCRVQGWVMSADGSNLTQLFQGDCCMSDWDGPIWSPDGTHVAFMEDSHGEEQWWSAPVDGSGPATTIDALTVMGWRQAPQPPIPAPDRNSSWVGVIVGLVLALGIVALVLARRLRLPLRGRTRW